eukprot:2814405-Pyramimonas_sp.AAC.1
MSRKSAKSAKGPNCGKARLLRTSMRGSARDAFRLATCPATGPRTRSTTVKECALASGSKSCRISM